MPGGCRGADGASVTLIGAVGQDVLADGALTGLKRAGVDLRHVVRAPASTGRAAVLVDPEGYTMVAADRGANQCARAGRCPTGCSVLVPRCCCRWRRNLRKTWR